MSLPPSGRGIYARGHSPDFLARFDFVVVNGRRVGAEAVARELVRRGVQVWLYAGPEHFEPNVWPETMAMLEQRALAWGAVGVIADTEGGWNDLGAALAPQLEGLAIALRHARRAGLRVGVTSYPLWAHRARLAELLAGDAFGSPQIYIPDALARRPPGAAVLAEWARLFGRAIPSVAAWPKADAQLTTPAAYEAYLAGLPRAVGAVGWTVNDPPAWLIERFLAFSPAGNPIARGALELRDAVSTTAGKVALVVLALALALGAALALAKR